MLLPEKVAKCLLIREGSRVWCRVCGVMIALGKSKRTHHKTCPVPHLRLSLESWERAKGNNDDQR